MPSLRFRLLTLIAAFAAWALVAVGGVVRVTASGLGCPHWPLCTSKALPLDQKASIIEYSHRAVVALVSVLAVVVAGWAWRSYRSRRDILWPALLAVVLVPFQALLGAVAVWLDLPGWVVAFHFVVGLLFLATVVLAATAAWRRAGSIATPGFSRLAWASALVGLAVVSVGAAVVATEAAGACGTQWPACNGGFAAGGGHAQLQVAHRMLAYTVAALALALLVLALRRKGPRLAGSLPLLAVLAQMGFGIAIVLVGGDGRAHQILAGLHVGGAGTVWAALVALAAMTRPAGRPAGVRTSDPPSRHRRLTERRTMRRLPVARPGSRLPARRGRTRDEPGAEGQPDRAEARQEAPEVRLLLHGARARGGRHEGDADGEMTRPQLDFDRRPILVFWEMTRACLLACRHCRASAIADPLPGELSTEEGERFLESLLEFGRPYPVLVLTGGDVLMRPDVLRLVTKARRLGLSVAVSPSVTPRLEPAALDALRRTGVKVASLSLDGSRPETHEGLRGVSGHFEETLDALRRLRAQGFTVQVNTVVRPENVEELPELAEIVDAAGAAIWEVFFLIRVGRGSELAELSPAENEDVCHFLVDASRFGFIVRTVEAPFFRRIVRWRLECRDCETGPLYDRLTGRLRALLGEPRCDPRAQTKGTRDGKGIVFVAHDGDVYPAGFLPIAVGNVRRERLADVYRDSPLLREIRSARFAGRCGECEYADLCGGSRARAYAASGDPLGEDPACAYLRAR